MYKNFRKGNVMDKNLQNSIASLGVSSKKEEIEIVSNQLKNLIKKYVMKSKIRDAENVVNFESKNFNLGSPFVFFGIAEALGIAEKIKNGNLEEALKCIRENAGSVEYIEFIEGSENNSYIRFLFLMKYFEEIKDTLIESYTSLPCVNSEERSEIFKQKVSETLKGAETSGDLKENEQSSL